MSEALGPEIFFGGPDRPPRCLRDLLQTYIEASPAGSRIDWATYYFRDRALAQALIDASRRGVTVTLHMEGAPRRAGTNDAVIAMLAADGLRGGLHVHRPGKWLPSLHPHLHTKIYAFSDPGVALVGSFNPSGDEPESAEVIEEIGDQDRGHNMLVAYRDPALVEALRHYVEGLGDSGDRFRGARSVQSGLAEFYFYPRLRTGIIDRHLAMLGRSSRIRGAISHLKGGFLARELGAAARRGASVELMVHDTERRVPEAVIEGLHSSGVSIRRYAHPERLPLHSKFLLLEEPHARTAWFGSFNFNPRSRFLNHELLVKSREPAIWEALDRRFDKIAAEGAAYRRPS